MGTRKDFQGKNRTGNFPRVKEKKVKLGILGRKRQGQGLDGGVPGLNRPNTLSVVKEKRKQEMRKTRRGESARTEGKNAEGGKGTMGAGEG